MITNRFVCTLTKCSPLLKGQTSIFLTRSLYQTRPISLFGKKKDAESKKEDEKKPIDDDILDYKINLQKQQTQQAMAQKKIFGVSSEVYIPPMWKRMPNAFLHPLSFTQAVVRRVYSWGFNTVQVALFKWQSEMKIDFELYRQLAIKNYVKVNKNFAEKNVAALKNDVTIWVEEALKMREADLPESKSFNWEIVKFNEMPKLMKFMSLAIPNQPLELIQVIYRFNTEQALTVTDKKTGKQVVSKRQVVDYYSYLIDTYEGTATLMGSVFENTASDKLPPLVVQDQDPNLTLDHMKRCGDIFRSAPATIAPASKPE